MKKITVALTLLSTLALAEVAMTTAYADSVGGASSATRVIAGRDTHTFTRSFYGGETARVIVRGDGDSDLDLFIYDEFGNLVAKDDDDTDYCVCTWVPRRTGRFTIRVVNVGRAANLYCITTN